jgi:hypothetical protein
VTTFVRTADCGNLLAGTTDSLEANACVPRVSSSTAVVSSCCIDLPCSDYGKWNADSDALLPFKSPSEAVLPFQTTHRMVYCVRSSRCQLSRLEQQGQALVSAPKLLHS